MGRIFVSWGLEINTYKDLKMGHKLENQCIV